MKGDKNETSQSGGPQAAAGDTVANNRALPVVEASKVPAVPAGYKPSDAVALRALPKSAETQRSEMLDALRETGDKGGQLQVDLGQFAPDGARAIALRNRLVAVRSAKSRVESLLHYLNEIEDIANSDALAFIRAIKKELLHVADHRPSILDEYPAVMAYVDQKRDAIVEGRANAKAKRESQGAAVKAAVVDTAAAGGVPEAPVKGKKG